MTLPLGIGHGRGIRLVVSSVTMLISTKIPQPDIGDRKCSRRRQLSSNNKPALLSEESSSSSSSTLLSAPDVIHILPLFQIRKSPKGGYGGFATEDILPFSEIVQERPLLISSLGEFSNTFQNLPEEAKGKLLELSWFPGAADDKMMALFMTNRSVLSRHLPVLENISELTHALLLQL